MGWPEDNYKLLASEIVLRAADDYRKACRQMRHSSSDLVRNKADRWRAEIRWFFQSDYFELFTDLDGPDLLRRLDEENEQWEQAQKGKYDGKAKKGRPPGSRSRGAAIANGKRSNRSGRKPGSGKSKNGS